MNFPEFEQLLEIGDAGVTALPWKKVSIDDAEGIYQIQGNGITYMTYWHERSFSMRNDKELTGVDFWELSFRGQDGFGQITNNNELFPLMSSITEITKDFIKQKKPQFILYKGFKNDGNDNNKRNKLYNAFLEKQIKKFKSATFFEKHDWVVICFDKKLKQYSELITNRMY